LEPTQLARFEALVLPHLNAAYSLAHYLLRDDEDAQDATHDAVLRALRHFGGFRGEDARAWLLAIVRNTCHTWYRRRRADDKAIAFDEELHSEAGAEEHPEAAMLRAADRETVGRALEALPAEFREVIVLRELQGLSYREIAEITEVPVGTVMSRLSRARRHLERAVGAR
jgi:RNA polymerase sigma factor (sigma-70 family)